MNQTKYIQTIRKHEEDISRLRNYLHTIKDTESTGFELKRREYLFACSELELQKTLNIGTRLNVIGWLMLAGLNSGKWLIVNKDDETYYLAKTRKSKRLRFYKHDIHNAIIEQVESLNRIEILN